jgi:outer membrane protein
MNKLLVTLLLVVLSFWPVYAHDSANIGVVDGEKLFDEYPNAQEASKKIADAQDELRKEISESEKVYTEFEKGKKSEAEKLTKQKELQAKIDVRAQDTRKMIENLSGKIEADILQSIKKVASVKGIDVVFDKRAVLSGGVDITDEVVLILKKKSTIAEKRGEVESKTTSSSK